MGKEKTLVKGEKNVQYGKKGNGQLLSSIVRRTAWEKEKSAARQIDAGFELKESLPNPEMEPRCITLWRRGDPSFAGRHRSEKNLLFAGGSPTTKGGHFLRTCRDLREGEGRSAF